MRTSDFFLLLIAMFIFATGTVMNQNERFDKLEQSCLKEKPHDSK